MLHFWECATMIGFYVLYISCVIFPPWFQACRQRRLLREARAGGHHVSSTVGVFDIGEDNGVEDYGSSSERTSLVSVATSSDESGILGQSVESFSRGGGEDCKANGQRNKSLDGKTVGMDQKVLKRPNVHSTSEHNTLTVFSELSTSGLVPLQARFCPPPLPGTPSSWMPDQSSPHASLRPTNKETFTRIGQILRWCLGYLKPPVRPVMCVLFPTLCTWRSLSPLEKFSGIISAPAILCLTLTVPLMYVENGAGDAEHVMLPRGLAELHATTAHQSGAGIVEYPTLEPTPYPIEPDYYNVVYSDCSSVSIVARNQREVADFGTMRTSTLQPGRVAKPSMATLKPWDRWLLATQCIFSPVFLALAFVSNILLCHVQYTLIGGSILLFLLLATTSSDKRPIFWPLLCFVGLVVSVVWISIAVTEVVGVLKAFGIILGINDAILGLTVLAIGNSLGDLFANIAMTRLHFPVLALSGCFGAPMVNILLGIGVSGLYMILTQSDRNGAEYDPYQIEISITLIILWATLLVTLIMLLVLVPLNGWRMDRRIGIGLIAIWTSSTVGNLIMEVLRGQVAGDSPTSAVRIFEHNT
jgi:solute carrier family 24 (sodium/potassium/calcium exchanger), member 6